MNLKDTAGKFFGVTFIKRSNGKERNMVARLGVRKHLKDGEKKYNPEDHNLLTVYEIGKGYKSIPLDGLVEIRFQGKKIKAG